jgi:metal-responsive CopG/Arc/MetJ family transcriptional regulator
MKKSRVTVTLSEELLQELDAIVRKRQAEQAKAGMLVSANRSQVLEELLRSAVRRAL